LPVTSRTISSMRCRMRTSWPPGDTRGMSLRSPPQGRDSGGGRVGAWADTRSGVAPKGRGGGDRAWLGEGDAARLRIAEEGSASGAQSRRSVRSTPWATPSQRARSRARATPCGRTRPRRQARRPPPSSRPIFRSPRSRITRALRSLADPSDGTAYTRPRFRSDRGSRHGAEKGPRRSRRNPPVAARLEPSARTSV
jgi:hypothetical protein